MLDKDMEKVITPLVPDCMTDWDISFDDPEEIKQVMKQVLAKDTQKNYYPVTIATDCPYAEYVEFGTGPATHTSDKQVQENRLKAMKKWVVARGIVDGKSDKETTKAAEHLIGAILKNGIHPNPYIRTAMARVEYEMNHDHENMTVQEAGDMLLRFIQEHLADVPVVTDTGTALKDSFIKIEYDENALRLENDGSITVSGIDSNPSPDEDIWKDKSYRGKNGKLPTNHFHSVGR